MAPMAKFYFQTWWVWLLLMAGFIVLAWKVSCIFWLFVPGILIYSVYFGWVRVTDESRKNDGCTRRFAAIHN